MTNAAISVTLALMAAIMAYLGVHMSLHPPSERKQRAYKIAFVVLGLASVGLVWIQAKRGDDAAAETAKSQEQATSLLAKVDRQAGEITQHPQTVEAE